jgi:hypothetical protein
MSNISRICAYGKLSIKRSVLRMNKLLQIFGCSIAAVLVSVYPANSFSKFQSQDNFSYSNFISLDVDRTKYVQYSTFISMIQANEINDVTVIFDKDYGSFRRTHASFLGKEGVRFLVYLPYDPDFNDIMAKNGVNIVLSQRHPSSRR